MTTLTLERRLCLAIRDENAVDLFKELLSPDEGTSIDDSQERDCPLEGLRKLEWNWDTSPLHLTCYLGRVDLARMLLDAGAAVDSLMVGINSRVTPLQLAVHRAELDTVRLLLERGADASTTEGSWGDRRGSAMDWAAQEGNVELIKVLKIHEMAVAKRSKEAEIEEALSIRCKIGASKIQLERMEGRFAEVDQLLVEYVTELAEKFNRDLATLVEKFKADKALLEERSVMIKAELEMDKQRLTAGICVLQEQPMFRDERQVKSLKLELQEIDSWFLTHLGDVLSKDTHQPDMRGDDGANFGENLSLSEEQQSPPVLLSPLSEEETCVD